jgi:excisionase family DNA binding protein
MKPQFLSVEEVADYLHLTTEDVLHRVNYREIPFEKRGSRIVFNKSEIEMWASQRILKLPNQRLTAYHEKSTLGTREILPQQAMLVELIRPAFIELAMTAKTKASVLRELVGLAEQIGSLNDAKTLLASLVAREELCPTAMPGGFALPHPRCHEPYLIEKSFIVVGRSVQAIHFGAPDGQPTNLFFLICCQDDRLHLHTLTRLCHIFQKTNLLAQIQIASAAETVYDSIIAAEQEVLGWPQS